MAKVYTGTYGNGTSPENSLNTALLQYPEIARTLICEPEIMLLDEPFAGIDPIAVEEIKELLLEIAKKNIAILVTDHNVKETLSLCKKAIILSDGMVIAEGNEEYLKQNDHVKKEYFGKMFS